MLFARPIYKLLHKSTGAILVEMFAITSVAVLISSETPFRIFSVPKAHLLRAFKKI